MKDFVGYRKARTPTIENYIFEMDYYKYCE